MLSCKNEDTTYALSPARNIRITRTGSVGLYKQSLDFLLQQWKMVYDDAPENIWG